MAAEELMVVLKRGENSGFGFSLLGTTGPPHVIYDIIENSPAAECGMVEAGDIILKINGTDVHRYTTKEVLKCLRLSDDLVTLQLKRDPKIKAHIQEHLAHASNFHQYSESESLKIYDVRQNRKSDSPTNQYISGDVSPTGRFYSSSQRSCTSEPLCRPSRIPTAVRSPPPKSVPQSPQSKKPRPSHIPKANGNNLVNINLNQLPQQPASAPPIGKARFEAYMMTGDLILNLSRTPQSSNLITSYAKKVDSLSREPSQRIVQPNGAIAPRASFESTPSSSPTHSENSDSVHTNKTDRSKKDFLITNSDKNFKKDSSDDIRKNNDVYKVHEYENLQSDEDCRRGGGDAEQRVVIDLNDETSACVSSSSSSINRRNLSESIDIADSTKGFRRTESHHQQISSSSSSTVKSEFDSPDTSFSVPTSPVSLSTPLIEVKSSANSVPTSPEQSAQEVVRRQHNGVIRKCDAAGFRTSKSEDHLQQTQRDGMGAVIPIDIDEDVNSSLNTLLDTRQDSEDSQDSNRDRIVWTYNAPVTHHQHITSPNSHSSSVSSSPQRSDSPASPTSVSSSVMSSNSGSKGAVGGHHNNTALLPCPFNGDQSVSEAVSNISSPDYQDDDNLLSSKDLAGMALSDPSDSDSTILVSEAMQRKREMSERDHRIVIKIKGSDSNLRNNPEYSELKDSEDELATLTEDAPTMLIGVQDTKESSPPVSDDGSDVESLHSYHYSPKAVDMPSAVRLAKRLYSLDGFKKSDVSRHLSKNNDFSRAVADEYLKYFNFDKKTLDQALREFLQQFSLSGETQERERVLVHFSKRYLDCNPGSFNSQDAVHTLTCAIMLLNTDLHGPNIGRKMTCAEFVDNLAELNDGENFPKDVLKYLYQAIKNHPLEWALDEDTTEQKQRLDGTLCNQIGTNPFLDTPQASAAIEYKKGYVMRKCCFDSNYKKTPFGKRSWKMFYCTLRDLVLYLHKDEHGFRKNQMSDNVHNAIRIHHALATKATDYNKKQHVFRLQAADQSEYLFQTSDSKELQSWIDTINFVCASFSAPPLEGGVGSQKRFQRPLLPSTHTKLLLKEQLTSHDQQVVQLENTLSEHRKGPVPTKGLALQNFKEKEAYLQYELKRYKTYVNVLSSKLMTEQDLQSCLLGSEESFTAQRAVVSGNSVINQSSNNVPPQQQQGQQQQTNRYSYRAAIYRTDAQQDLG